MSGLVYPRLGHEAGLVRLNELVKRSAQSIEVAFQDPDAVPVTTGTPATEQKLRDVRKTAREAVARWDGRSPGRSEAAEWDAAVGKALHESMDIVPADASHEGPWSFLSLVVMPDLAVARFPARHSSRMLGGPRNVFRRPWWRYHVLGDLACPADAKPLGEDELVGIFERSKMSRNRTLARALARSILGYTGPNRSEFTRRLARSVRAETGPLLLDILERVELERLVEECAERAAA